MKPTVWYTLGEAEKATGVPRGRLDHACRVNRLPYRRSETGARLVSHDVVEKLRKEGLKAFPRPYDPIASPIENEASSSNPTSSVCQTLQRERIDQKRGEIEELRISRDLQQLKEQERKEKAERRAAAKAEREAQAEERVRELRHRQQLQLEAARQAEARDQATREAESRQRRQQWEISWLDYALKALPNNAPHHLELDIHHAVVELLPKLDSYQPEQLTRRLIQAAIQKALQPWHRSKEIDNIIDQARNQLPVLVRSWTNIPNEWDMRVIHAATDAIASLEKDAPLAEIRVCAVEAGNKVRAEYDVWKAGEDHRQACEHLVRSVFDGEDQREAVRRGLEKLPVGASRAKMESTRDGALAPYKAAAKAVANADRYLQHMSVYIEQLGNEETGEWELGDWSDRYKLAGRLSAQLRPLLIQKLIETNMDQDESNRFIESWVDRNLDLTD